MSHKQLAKPAFGSESMGAEKALDLNATVMTPENIQFEYRLAGPFRRFPAFLLDLLVRAATLGGIGILIACSGIIAFFPSVGAIGFFIMAVGYFLFDWFYGLFFETIWSGRTPGKKICGLRVISVDGRPISAYQATIRNFLRLGDLAPLASFQIFSADAPPAYWIPTGGVAILCILLTGRFQRLGDLAAGTMVIVDERKWVPPKLKLNDPAINQLVESISPSFRMNRTMLRTVALYVERRIRISQARRRELAALLAREVMPSAGVPPTTDPDLFLCALYKREYDAQLKSNEKPEYSGGSVPRGTARVSEVRR
jgi:uncharacterized RDD family membrane protein YckC